MTGLIARFGLAGLANTAVGFAVIAALDLGLGLDPHVANAAGYLVGLGMGFAMNRGFVFRSGRRAAESGPRFVLAALGCFALNQAGLAVAAMVLGDADWARLAAQLAGMGIYSVTLFLICRHWVFRPSTAPGRLGL